MKKFVKNNSEGIAFSIIALVVIGVITFNAVTYGICDTGSFTF
jgi:hypothetical protein